MESTLGTAYRPGRPVASLVVGVDHGTLSARAVVVDADAQHPARVHTGCTDRAPDRVAERRELVRVVLPDPALRRDGLNGGVYPEWVDIHDNCFLCEAANHGRLANMIVES